MTDILIRDGHGTRPTWASPDRVRLHRLPHSLAIPRVEAAVALAFFSQPSSRVVSPMRPVGAAGRSIFVATCR